MTSSLAPHKLRGASDPRFCGTRVERGGARMAENPPRTQIGRGQFVNGYKAESVELAGFEPVTPSLRKQIDHW
jgi:hypothetical protein